MQKLRFPFALGITLLLCFLGSSCEDKALAAKSREQRARIAALEAEVHVLELSFPDEPDEEAGPSLDEAKKELEAAQEKVETLRAEIESLNDERDQVSKEFDAYKRKYRIPE